MEFNQIKELIELFSTSALEELSVEHYKTKVKMKKGNSGQVVASTPVMNPTIQTQSHIPAVEKPLVIEKPFVLPQESSVPSTENLVDIVSPMVGTFYASSSPENPAFVSKGDKVKKGDVVCILEAMKLFNEIEAEESGEIVEVLVGNGELVEYGQTLFRVRP